MKGASAGAHRSIGIALRPLIALRPSLLLISMTGPGSIDRPAAAAPAIINGRIAFASARTGNQDIFLMNADGSGQVQVFP